METHQMASLEIVMREKGKDPSPEETKEWGGSEVTPLMLKRLLIVEGGTGRGRTSLSFYLEDQEGKKYYANTTGRIILAMARATRGAMERFGDDPDAA